MIKRDRKTYCESVFDILCGNVEQIEKTAFFDAFYVEMNYDDCSIDFYENIDYPHQKPPVLRMICTEV